MSTAAAPDIGEVRAGLAGAAPLTARLEPWMVAAAGDHELLDGAIARWGSPVNLLQPGALARNAAELTDVARDRGVDLRIFFARKANKALAFVDEALRLGLGVDVASERELRQVLERGAGADDVVVTAAVKPRTMLELCVSSGVTIVLDNEDELALLQDVLDGAGPGAVASVAVRITPSFSDGRAPSRFGMSPAEAVRAVTGDARLTVVGVHFHLDGYAAGDRRTVLAQALATVDELRTAGHAPTFIDMGGGIPMRYLDSRDEWEAFWAQHRAALLGDAEPLTFEGEGLGLVEHRGELLGVPALYPYHQALVRGGWLGEVLTPELADGLRSRGLELRCEPGRSLLDGCGMTAARVEFRKQREDGTWLVGLAMNRTQCRSTSADFLVDPLLARAEVAGAGAASTGPIEGYLVGAYCIERELLTWRRLRFPGGVSVGDIVVFPNTAGYLMHILESASHQIPLARNVVVAGDGRSMQLDRIDAD